MGYDRVAALFKEALEGALAELREDYTHGLDHARLTPAKGRETEAETASQQRQGELDLVESDPFGDWDDV